MLTAAGTALGAAAFVATLGLSSTLTQQVSNSFDVRRATEVVVGPTDQQFADEEDGRLPIGEPTDAPARAHLVMMLQRKRGDVTPDARGGGGGIRVQADPG